MLVFSFIIRTSKNGSSFLFFNYLHYFVKFIRRHLQTLCVLFVTLFILWLHSNDVDERAWVLWIKLMEYCVIAYYFCSIIWCVYIYNFYTFHNPYLRLTVAELQQFRDVFIRNTHVGISLVTVEGCRLFVPLCQSSWTGFCCKDRELVAFQRSLNHNRVIFYLHYIFRRWFILKIIKLNNFQHLGK